GRRSAVRDLHVAGGNARSLRDGARPWAGNVERAGLVVAGARGGDSQAEGCGKDEGDPAHFWPPDRCWMSGRGLYCAADMQVSAGRRSGQDCIGGARDSCGRCRGCNDSGSAKNVGRFGVAGKRTGENATFAGTRAGELLHAARQASQSLRCCVGAGWWSPEPSAVQMIVNGSNPEWPATTKPAIKACSAIA